MKLSLVTGCLMLILGIFTAARGASSNPVSVVPLRTALSDAQDLVANRSDLQVFRAEGSSMLPYFGAGTVLVVKKMPFEKLKEDMVVVYVNRFKMAVAHRLVSPTSTGWGVIGHNNKTMDSTPVSAENLIGVVYAIFHSNALPADSQLTASETQAPIAMAAPAM